MVNFGEFAVKQCYQTGILKGQKLVENATTFFESFSYVFINQKFRFESCQMFVWKIA